MKPWVKAGIIGGILQVVFTLPIILFYFLPVGTGSVLALCICCLFYLIVPVPGILGAHWLPSPRTTSQGATSGALAGLLATGIDSFVTLLLMLVISQTGLSEKYIQQLIPNAQQVIQQTGMEFWFSTTGLLLQTGIGLIFHIITGVVLSILGALIYIAIKKDGETPLPLGES